MLAARMRPVPITALSLCNGMGMTTAEVLAGLQAGRSGLGPCPSEIGLRGELAGATVADGEVRPSSSTMTRDEAWAFQRRQDALLAQQACGDEAVGRHIEAQRLRRAGLGRAERGGQRARGLDAR